MRKRKLRTIILLEISTVMIAFMGLFMLVASYRYRNSIQQEKYAVTQFYIRNALEKMDDFFYELDNISYLAFYKEDLIEKCRDYHSLSIKEQVESRKLFSTATTEMLKLEERMYAVYLFDREGRSVFNHIYTGNGLDERLEINMSVNQKLLADILGKVEGTAYGGMQYGLVTLDDTDQKTVEKLSYIFAIRELRTFRPYETAGYIVFFAPIDIFDDLLSVDSDISNVLVVEDSGKIVYEISKQWIGKSAESYSEGIMNVFSSQQRGYYTTVAEDSKVLVSGGISLYSDWKILAIQKAENVFYEANEMIKMMIILFFIMLCFTIALIACFISRLTRPLAAMTEHLKVMNLDNPGEEIPNNARCSEFLTLTEAYNAMLGKINRMLEMEYKSVIKEKEYQLSLLRMQIHPHFLYNTLDTIRMSAVVNRDQKTADMILALSDFFRRSVIKEKIVLMEDEFSQVESYLSLLKIRYENLKTEIYLDDELRYIEIPSFVLQPLVENAFIHGLKPCGCEGVISVRAEMISDKTYMITVWDNGVGAPEEIICNLNSKIVQQLNADEPYTVSQIGLLNVSWRLSHFFTNSVHIEVSIPKNEGFCVKIVIMDSEFGRVRIEEEKC